MAEKRFTMTEDQLARMIRAYVVDATQKLQRHYLQRLEHHPQLATQQDNAWLAHLPDDHPLESWSPQPPRPRHQGNGHALDGPTDDPA